MNPLLQSLNLTKFDNLNTISTCCVIQVYPLVTSKNPELHIKLVPRKLRGEALPILFGHYSAN